MRRGVREVHRGLAAKMLMYAVVSTIVESLRDAWRARVSIVERRCPRY